MYRRMNSEAKKVVVPSVRLTIDGCQAVGGITHSRHLDESHQLWHTLPRYQPREAEMETDLHDRLRAYVTNLCAIEDSALRELRANAEAAGLPSIQLKPDEAKLLQFLIKAVGARRVVELGTLGGYSGTWIARALPADGRLITLELDSRHAEVARRNFAHTGVAQRVEIRVGLANDTLKTLSKEGPFDAVFIDADKPGYPTYLDWALNNVRAGGLIAAHNAFRQGDILDSQSKDASSAAIRQFNETLAHSPRVLSTIIQVGDGMAVAIVL
jgi:caffeoyl-CoA O-methyltransferase